MKLSDIMSAMLLSTYAEVALIIFLAVFVAVVLQLINHKNDATFERLSRLPLEDESTDPQTPRTKSQLRNRR